MALIQCRECGQMVSEKAAACPHCGCPVGMPKVCPECGQVVEDNYSFCKNCGCPVNPVANMESATSPNQEMAQVDYSCEDEEKRSKRKLWLWLTLAALPLIGGTATWLYWQNSIPAEAPESIDTLALVDDLTMDTIEADAIEAVPAVEEQYVEAEAEAVDADTYDDSYESADIEEVKSWIQGNWRYRMITEFGAMETRIGINGDYLVEMMNGEMTYSGEYTIDGDHLSYNHTYIIIDRANHRLMADDTHPFKRF